MVLVTQWHNKDNAGILQVQNISKERWFSLNMGEWVKVQAVWKEILLLWWFNSLGSSAGYGLVAIYRDFLASLRDNDFLLIGMELHHYERKGSATVMI
mgnify:CR=1 FL=1